MITIRPFGEGFRAPAPARWGCSNLDATPILASPLVVEHHYGPGGEMPEHAADEAILCVCIDGRGFVKVGDKPPSCTGTRPSCGRRAPRTGSGRRIRR